MAFTIGASGLHAMPTFTDNTEVGQRWVIWLLSTGLRLAPASDGFESLTMKMYFDGSGRG
jgi:hypothetical protein